VTPTTIAIMMPKSMGFKQGAAAPYNAVTEELGAQTYVARNVQPSQPVEFTVSGKGELPRDAGTPAAGTGQAASTTAPVEGDPNTDTRPGGGLGVPVDKDAQRDPWAKYKWWIIGALGLAMAGMAGVIFKPSTAGPSAPLTAGYASLPSAPHTGSAMQVLRDEMFAVETDRLEGRLTDAEYAELKAAYDVVLRRTLSRTAQG
jgi:hypothetical protein